MIRRFFQKGEPAVEPRTEPLVAIVDDNRDLCLLVEQALRERGYATASAHDGEEGLELVRRRRPDALVLDIKMPRLNGYQVLTRLHQDPALADLPVVVITSVDEEQQYNDEEWARRLGVRRFLSKPFSPDRVADAVAELIPPTQKNPSFGAGG